MMGAVGPCCWKCVEDVVLSFQPLSLLRCVCPRLWHWSWTRKMLGIGCCHVERSKCAIGEEGGIIPRPWISISRGMWTDWLDIIYEVESDIHIHVLLYAHIAECGHVHITNTDLYILYIYIFIYRERERFPRSDLWQGCTGCLLFRSYLNQPCSKPCIVVDTSWLQVCLLLFSPIFGAGFPVWLIFSDGLKTSNPRRSTHMVLHLSLFLGRGTNQGMIHLNHLSFRRWLLEMSEGDVWWPNLTSQPAVRQYGKV